MFFFLQLACLIIYIVYFIYCMYFSFCIVRLIGSQPVRFFYFFYTNITKIFAKGMQTKSPNRFPEHLFLRNTFKYQQVF